jgi:hypothetical protein
LCHTADLLSTGAQLIVVPACGHLCREHSPFVASVMVCHDKELVCDDFVMIACYTGATPICSDTAKNLYKQSDFSDRVN